MPATTAVWPRRTGWRSGCSGPRSQVDRWRPSTSGSRPSTPGGAGDIGLWSRALGWYVATLMYGPRRRGGDRRGAGGDRAGPPGPYLAACVDLGRAEVERLQGRVRRGAAARRRARWIGSARWGCDSMAAACDQSCASIELSSGDAVAARASLLRSEAILAGLEERAMRSTTQAMLARVHARLSCLDAARAALELAEELSAPGDVANFAITHGVRARLALADGDGTPPSAGPGARWTRRSDTDFLQLQAETRLELARVLVRAGAGGQAQSEARARWRYLRPRATDPAVTPPRRSSRRCPRSGFDACRGGFTRERDFGRHPVDGFSAFGLHPRSQDVRTESRCSRPAGRHRRRRGLPAWALTAAPDGAVSEEF